MAMIRAGKLAFRVERDLWCCYWQDDIHEPLFFGSIHMNFASNPVIKQRFMALMKKSFSFACEEITGEKPARFTTTPAPESERPRE